MLRGAACARTSGATWGSGWRTKRVGEAPVMNRGIVLGGESLGEAKAQEGLDWQHVLNPRLSERTLKGS